MYQAKFAATDDADWAVAVELFDDTTGEPLSEATDATFAVEVSDCGTAVLSAETGDDEIEKPEDHIVQWHFTKAQMGGLDTGKTYAVGLTMEIASGTIQILVGSLAVIDGNVG